MVKISSNAGGVGSVHGRGGKIPHALRTKSQNIKQKQYNVMNSIKTLKMVHIKKNLKKKISHHSAVAAY